MGEDWLARVKEKLAAYRQAARVEGELAPIDPKTLAKIERALGVKLPADYRAVLLQVGNGGFGPDYGLAPLTLESLAGIPGKPLPDPKRPFPLKERFSVLDAKGKRRRFPIPKGTSVHDGAVMLTDIGCGYFTFLIVKGPKKGEVWADYTAAMEDAVITPVAPSFREWLEGWLDDALRAVIGERVRSALEKGDGIKSADHALIERYASLVVPDEATVLLTCARIEVDLYLGRREEAEALLARADEKHASDPSLSQVRRFVLRDAFAEAEGEDLAAIARAASHAEADVRLAVAKNPRASAEVLERLAGDPSSAVRTAAVQHPSAPKGALAAALRSSLERFLDDPTEPRFFEVEAAVRNESSPADALGDLVARAEERPHPLGPWILRAAVLHRGFDPNQVVDHRLAIVRHAAAVHPALSADHVTLLAHDPVALVRLTIAIRDDLPRAVFEKLASDPNDVVRGKIAQHPKVPVDLLVRMSLDPSSDVMRALADNPRVPKEAQEVLTLHPHYIAPEPRFAVSLRIWPRSGVAGALRHVDLDGPSAEAMKATVFSHPACPVPLLAPFIEMQYGMGGYQMAFHPLLFTDASLVERLLSHPYGYTRKNMAGRRELDEAMIEKLAKDPVPMVRATIAERGDLDHELYGKLANDANAEVRAGAAASPLLTPKLAEKLATDGERYVRRAVLRNPKTPHTIAEVLAKDTDPEVRKWAAERPLETATLERLAKDADEGVRKWATWRLRANDLLDAARRS